MKREEFTVKETNGEEIKLAVRNITYEDQEEANRVYSAKVASLLREKGPKKLLLRQQLDEYLKENNIWTSDDEAKINKISSEIEELFNQLKKGGKKISEGREICIQIMDKRKDMIKIATKRQLFDDITIESVADNERLDYYIYACTVHADSGEQYWQSFEDMKNDKASEVFANAYANVMKIVYGIDPEFEKTLPENKWLIKYGFANEKLEYTDRKTGEKVDKFGKKVEDIEKEIKDKLAILQGDIVEEAPFVDDETNEPVIVNSV